MSVRSSTSSGTRNRGRGPGRKRPARGTRVSERLWSARVTRESNALDLEAGVFAQRDPRKVALSLRRSAQGSTRRKGGSFRSAMSMLSFYINRAGKGLPASRRAVLNRAKEELRRLYGKRRSRS